MKKFLALLWFISTTLMSSISWADSYAVVDQNNVVQNVIEYDGNSAYNPGAGMTLVQSSTAGKGWNYNPATGVFSAPASQAISASKMAADAIAAGLIVTSAANPALNGTYGLDQKSQNNVSATTTYILLNNSFPGGNSTMQWIDQNNVAHLWPNVAEFKAFATAYANYVAAVSLYAASNGASGAIPSNQVSIP